MRLGILATVTGVFAASSVAACQGSYCTPGATSITEPEVIVTNAATGSAICDATVSVLSDAGLDASQGNLRSSAVSPDAASCVYIGFGFTSFTPGTNTILVSHAGFESQTVEVNVQATVCSGYQVGSPAPPQLVRVALNPN